MEFDYTDHEYLPECTEGCGPLTGWLQSKLVADQTGKNHQHGQGHAWTVHVRMRAEEGSA